MSKRHYFGVNKKLKSLGNYTNLYFGCSPHAHPQIQHLRVITLIE